MNIRVLNNESASRVALSEGLGMALVGTQDGNLCAVDIESGTELWREKTGSSSVYALSTDASMAVSGGAGTKSIKLWNFVRSGATLVAAVRVGAGQTRATAVCTARGRMVAGRNEALLLLDAGTGSILKTLNHHRHMVTALSFSTDGLTIASGSRDRKICISDSDSGALISTHSGHERPPAFLCSLNETVFASADKSGAIFWWQAGMSSPLASAQAPGAVVALSNDSALVMADNGGLTLFSLKNGQLVSPVPCHAHVTSPYAVGCIGMDVSVVIGTRFSPE